MTNAVELKKILDAVNLQNAQLEAELDESNKVAIAAFTAYVNLLNQTMKVSSGRLIADIMYPDMKLLSLVHEDWPLHVEQDVREFRQSLIDVSDSEDILPMGDVFAYLSTLSVKKTH